MGCYGFRYDSTTKIREGALQKRYPDALVSNGMENKSTFSLYLGTRTHFFCPLPRSDPFISSGKLYYH